MTDGGVGLVVYNSDLRLIIVGSPHIVVKHFDVIDMNDPAGIRAFNIEYESAAGLIGSHLLAFPGAVQLALNLANFQPPRQLRQVLIGVDIGTGESHTLAWDAYEHAVWSGFSGGGEQGVDFMLVFPFDDGILTFREGDHVIKTPWQLPKDLMYPPGDVIWAIVNNSEMVALYSNKTSVRTKTVRGRMLFRVFDKKANSWSSTTFPGGYTRVRGFGPWLAGLEEEEWERESPGAKERRKRFSETGFPIDMYLDENRVYWPGVLFLYNVHSKKTYTIETHQGDSEILLVEEDVVYYRVNRSIWRAKIGDKELEKPTLLVESDVVPDIHWAFTGPEQ